MFIKKIKEINHEIEQYMPFLERQAKTYNISPILLKIDCLLCRFLHGALPDQYIAFSMYKLSYYERKQFVTAKRSAKIEHLFNQSEDVRISNKHLFNKTFNKYLKREWIYVPECTEEEIVDFLRRNENIMIKPTNSHQGKGIRRTSSSEIKENELHLLLEQWVDEKCVLEEVIQQHHVLDKVNPTSCNTIRVCTVRDANGQVHIVGASLRGGKLGSIVDNFHAGSVQYPIDIESGVIIAGGVTFDGVHNVYYHPHTNVKMLGLEIPNWDLVVKMVKEAAKIPEKLRYLGWDVAILEEGCELIEANAGQGSNGMQQDGIGKYPFIMKYL